MRTQSPDKECFVFFMIEINENTPYLCHHCHWKRGSSKTIIFPNISLIIFIILVFNS